MLPEIIINKDVAIQNIKKMAEKAQANGIQFRPHFKTHISADVASWYKELGVTAITVSSIAMARYFANKGWNNITIAFPIVVQQLQEIKDLSLQIHLNIIVSSKRTAEWLSKVADFNLNVFLELDAGYHRTGIAANHFSEIEEIIEILKNNSLIKHVGFLAHFGNTYQAKSQTEIEKIFSESMVLIKAVKQKYPNQFMSIGDTPSCSIIHNFKYIDEIRPGNFVFYDWSQYNIGSCSLKNISLTMKCSVVANYPEQNRCVIHGGAVHFSKDYIELDHSKTYGQPVAINTDNSISILEGCKIISLSQEHGVISYPDPQKHLFNEGEVISIIPIHSCLAVSCMRQAKTIQGENLSFAGINEVQF